MKKIFRYWQILVILILAFVLRFYHYAQFPIAGETADERAWTMIGASLIQTGKPASWSYFGAYEKFNAVLKNTSEPIVSPALDHPPLFALIPGLAQTLKASWDQLPSIKVIRFPLLLLGTLNVYLLYLVAEKLFNQEKLALVASLIYATAPVFVFASRLVMAENLLITWILLSIYLCLTNYKRKYFFLTIIAVLAVLSKFSGIILPTSVFLYALVIKDKKLIIASLLGLVLGILAFFIYGAIYNWQLFLAIFFSQSNRAIGFFTFYNRFFLHPGVVDKLFTDGWLMLGFLASFFLIAFEKDKKYLFIKILFIINLLFIFASVGQQTFHAWYDYVWYPLFVLAITYLFNFIYQTKNDWLFALSYLTLLPLFQIFFLELKFNPSSLITRLILAFSLSPFLIKIFFKDKWGSKIMKFSLLILLIINLIVIVRFSQIQYWETDSFLYYR